MEDNLTEIFAADQMYKVKIIQELLMENNIESFILNEKGRSFLIGEVHLYVDKKDKAKAEKIIEGHEV